MKNWILYFFALVFTNTIVAQEICNNGIDDDNDGLMDCYDPDCCNNGSCATNYYNPCPSNLIGCGTDSIVGSFSMRQTWQSTELVNSLTNVVVGDLDGDNVPEIVATKLSSTSNGLVILNSQTGTVKQFINVPTGGTTYNSGLVLADMDNDGQAEIIYPKGDGFVECYEYNGTRLWRSSARVTTAYATLATVADLNQDGLPEVVVGRGILNGQNGTVMGTLLGSFGTTIGQNSIGDVGTAMAVDVFPHTFCTDCTGLEVVAGNTVYAVGINTTTNTAVVTATVVLNTEPDGMTSIADWDGDGDLDGIITHTAGNGLVRLYVWDLQTPTLMMTTGNIARLGGGTVGVGVATVADIDNNGMLEAAFVLNRRLVVVENSGTLKWSIANSDRSGLTGITLYDFDGNGQYELVYRDESRLRVYNANTGVLVQSLSCTSLTGSEYPVIADMDGDGETEILCTCGGSGLTGLVTAFESAGTPWVTSRPLWNQYQYFSTNINDDLTVPRIQQSHHIVGDSIELNAIRKQYQATGQTPLPDAAIQILSSNSVLPDSVDLNIQICNLGDAVLSANTPITFYNADPTTNNLAIPVGSISPIGQKVEAGNCITQTYRVLGTSSDIYAVVNCDNSILPIFNLSTDLPMTTIAECDYINNMANRTILLNSDLLQFKIRRMQGNMIKLDWVWGAPDLETGVTIERSETGIIFEPIGEVDGDITVFMDNYPLTGLNYYRLKRMTTDGRVIYSPIQVLYVNNTYTRHPIIVSPNPFNDYIEIQTQVNIKSIHIINTLGQIVYSTKGDIDNNEKVQLNLAYLPQGAYWIRILRTDASNCQYSIIKDN